MAERNVTLTSSQLHDIVGSNFMSDKNPPLGLATSAMLGVAEELRLISLAAMHGEGNNSTDLGNVLHSLSERLETMANVCNDLRADPKTS